MLVGAVLTLTGVLVFRVQPPPGRDASRFYSARVKPRLMHMHAPLKTTALRSLAGQHKGKGYNNSPREGARTKQHPRTRPPPHIPRAPSQY